eukprot:scaffold471_cov235-Pinguiococcus_pyrenoidosus.AAC.2
MLWKDRCSCRSLLEEGARASDALNLESGLSTGSSGSGASGAGPPLRDWSMSEPIDEDRRVSVLFAPGSLPVTVEGNGSGDPPRSSATPPSLRLAAPPPDDLAQRAAISRAERRGAPWWPRSAPDAATSNTALGQGSAATRSRTPRWQTWFWPRRRGIPATAARQNAAALRPRAALQQFLCTQMPSGRESRSTVLPLQLGSVRGGG